MSETTMDSVGWHNAYNEERLRANSLKSERDDLAHQLAAERARVVALAELVHSLQAPSDSNVMKQLTAIMEGRDNG